MPLRVQWAQDAGESHLDPNSASWKRFKQLYSYQFQEQKTVALFAPELSYKGPSDISTDQYDFGRYLRIVYLYVKPDKMPEFEDFVHKYIVPAATEILKYRDKVVNAPPPDQREYFKLAPHLRKVSINVNMPTIPEFELFIQRYLVPAAQRTNTPLLTYRTVTGDKHNYHMLYPFEGKHQFHYDNKNLIASSLLRDNHLQMLAESAGVPKFTLASYKPNDKKHAVEQALAEADELAAEFHSHAIEMEEIVYVTRPDMSSLLEGRYTKESVKLINASYTAGM